MHVTVDAPEGFDQAARCPLRKLDDGGVYRVLSVRTSPSEDQPDAHEVEVQATAGTGFTDDVFTVKVTAPDGFDQADRRAIRWAVQGAREWNVENAGVNVQRRLEGKSEYRVVSIGLSV